MAIINLRDYYPFYTSDCFMEVSEEVAEMFKEFDRKEAAYRLRTYRHKARHPDQGNSRLCGGMYAADKQPLYDQTL